MATGPLPRPEPLPDEPNPFSFREFVRSKARGDGASGDPLASSPGPVVLPLPGAPAEAGDEEEEEEEWSDSYQPLAVEQAHLAAAGSCAESPGVPPGPGRAPLRQPSYEQLKEENATLRNKINKLQILSEAQAEKMRKLEKKLEENKIKEEKEAQDLEAMVQHVEQNLQLMTKRAVKAESSVAKLRQENALLQAGQTWMPDLSVVPSDEEQWPETKTQEVPPQHEEELLSMEAGRALEQLPREGVESFQTHLDAFLCHLLQVQLRDCRSEVAALQAGQAGLAVAKHNAEVALQHLLRVTASSRSSLRQLLSGAESLQLIADLLRSIDRIGEVSEDGQ